MAKNKFSFNTNSNTYTVIYSAVIVVIVAFLLAFVSKTLKPTQDVNVSLDKKKQILASLNIRDLSDTEVSETYKNVIIKEHKAESRRASSLEVLIIRQVNLRFTFVKSTDKQSTSFLFTEWVFGDL